jgi:hypothetical protein
MCVETWPASPEQEAAYHEWYNETHMQETVGVKGFLSARRFAPVSHDGPFIAIYEIEDDDIEQVQARLTAFLRSDQSSTPVGVQRDPPPVVRFFREIAEYPTPGDG